MGSDLSTRAIWIMAQGGDCPDPKPHPDHSTGDYASPQSHRWANREDPSPWSHTSRRHCARPASCRRWSGLSLLARQHPDRRSPRRFRLPPRHRSAGPGVPRSALQKSRTRPRLPARKTPKCFIASLPPQSRRKTLTPKPSANGPEQLQVAQSVPLNDRCGWQGASFAVGNATSGNASKAVSRTDPGNSRSRPERAIRGKRQSHPCFGEDERSKGAAPTPARPAPEPWSVAGARRRRRRSRWGRGAGAGSRLR